MERLINLNRLADSLSPKPVRDPSHLPTRVIIG